MNLTSCVITAIIVMNSNKHSVLYIVIIQWFHIFFFAEFNIKTMEIDTGRDNILNWINASSNTYTLSYTYALFCHV